MIIRRDIEQRTDAWMEVKRAKISGTGMKVIIKSGVKAWMTYIYQLISEKDYDGIMTYNQGFLSQAVQWGQDMEPIAIAAYEAQYGYLVEDIGWLESTDSRFRGKLGCSPDGFVTVYHQVEVKCLSSVNHVRCIVENAYPEEHHPQVVNYFVVNGKLKTLSFIMYDPRMKKEENRLFVIDVYRKDLRADIKDAKEKVLKFLELKKEAELKYFGR